MGKPAVNTEMPSQLGASSTAVATLTYAFNNIGGSLLVVNVSASGGGITITSLTVTYNGVAMTPCKAIELGNTNASAIQQFYLLNPATGSHNVVVTSNISVDSLVSGAVSYTGAHPVTPIRNAVSNTQATASTTASLTIPSTLAGSQILGAMSTGTAGGVESSMTISGSGTISYRKSATDISFSGNGAGSRIVSPGGSVTLAWTVISDSHQSAIVEIQGTALELDTGFPVSSHPAFGTSFSSAPSASITTPGTNRLLVVVAHWALNAAGTVNPSPLACSGAGLTWTKLKEVSLFTSGSFPTGALAIFCAFAPSVISAQTITITRNSTDAVAQSAVVTVYSISGAAATQNGATAGHATAASSNRADSITGAAGNWIIGGVGDTGALGGAALTVTQGASKDLEVLDATNGDSYDTVSYQGAPSTAITVGFTGTDDSSYVALAEIQVASGITGTASIDGVGTTSATGTALTGEVPPTTWRINDSFPVPTAQQFDAAKPQWTSLADSFPLDVASLSAGARAATGTATLSTTATIAVVGRKVITATISISGVSAIAKTGVKRATGTASATAASSATGVGIKRALSVAAATAASAIAVTAKSIRVGVATRTSVGSMTLTTIAAHLGTATCSGTGNRVVTGGKRTTGTASSTASSAVTGTGIKRGLGTASSTAASTAAGTGVKKGFGTVTLSAAGTAVVIGGGAHAAFIVCTATISVTGKGAHSGTALISRAGTAIATGIKRATGTASSTASSTATGVGVRRGFGTANVSGISSLVPVGRGAHTGTTTRTSIGSASITGASARSFSVICEPNLAPNYGFQTGNASLPTGWGIYNNSAGLEPATSQRLRELPGGTNFYYSLSWGVNNTTQKGIVSTPDNWAWQPFTRYKVRFKARATGTNVGKIFILGWNTPPVPWPGSLGTIPPAVNPPLTTVWQDYLAEFQFGASTEVNGRLYISIASNSQSFGLLEIKDITVASAGTQPITGIKQAVKSVSVSTVSSTAVASGIHNGTASVTLSRAGITSATAIHRGIGTASILPAGLRTVVGRKGGNGIVSITGAITWDHTSVSVAGDTHPQPHMILADRGADLSLADRSAAELLAIRNQGEALGNSGTGTLLADRSSGILKRG